MSSNREKSRLIMQKRLEIIDNNSKINSILARSAILHGKLEFDEAVKMADKVKHLYEDNSVLEHEISELSFEMVEAGERLNG